MPKILKTRVGDDSVLPCHQKVDGLRTNTINEANREGTLTPVDCFNPKTYRVRDARWVTKSIQNVDNAEYSGKSYKNFRSYFDDHSMTEYHPECVGKFWKIPKGARNIRFELPFLRIDPPFYTAWTALITPLLLAVQASTGIDPNDPAVTEDDLQTFYEALYSMADPATSLLPSFTNRATTDDPNIIDGYLMYPDQSISGWLDSWLKCLVPPAVGLLPHSINPLIPSDPSSGVCPNDGTLSYHPEEDFCCGLQVFSMDGKLLIGHPLESSVAITYTGSHTMNTWPTLAPDGTASMWGIAYAMAQDQLGTPVTSGATVTPAQISAWLTSSYSDVFPSGFSFDDSEVNGTGTSLLKQSEKMADLHTLTIRGMTVQWSGASLEGTVLMSSACLRNTRPEVCAVDYWSIRSQIQDCLSAGQVLLIKEAKEDLIIGGISGAKGCPIYGQWDEQYLGGELATLPPTTLRPALKAPNKLVRGMPNRLLQAGTATSSQTPMHVVTAQSHAPVRVSAPLSSPVRIRTTLSPNAVRVRATPNIPHKVPATESLKEFLSSRRVRHKERE